MLEAAEIFLRVMRIIGPICIGLMGGFLRLFPPEPYAIDLWSLGFIFVGLLTLLAIVAEEYISWQNRKMRETEQNRRNYEFIMGFQELQSHIAQFNLPELSESIAAVREAVIPKIEIRSPTGGQRVSFKHAVEGSVRPPDTSIQVLVFAGDNQWHPQQERSLGVKSGVD
jgi:hypothetical protein